ncbi:MAG: efflux RND transporter periplasmic adaptor subunit [Chromatiales bacterium]|nr:efflux RND transporter periplasmic adaptor subunit [Chromatiales bacterium]
MKISRTRVAWVLAIVAVAGALFWVVRRPGPAVVTEPVRRDIVEVVVASGRLQAIRETQVGAESSGIVESLAVNEGAVVRTGDLLGRLTLGETAARLAATAAALDVADKNLRAEEAALEKARQDLARLEPLAARKQVSTAELERAAADARVQTARTEAARARRREAAAEVERVRPEFGRREVRAPFNGVITDRLVEPGTPVSAAQGWFRISEMDATEIEVETDETNLGKLRVGQPVVAFVPAYPDKPFRGTLTQVGPFVDSERGVVRLKITPEGLPDFVLPNMTVDVSIEVRRADNALALPVSAVALQANPPFVLAVGKGGVLERTPVRVIGRNPDWVAVADLPEGTTVVRQQAGLSPGRKVRPVAGPPADGGGGGPPKSAGATR